MRRIAFRLENGTVKKGGDVLQLGDVVGPVAAVFDEQREDVIEFAAGVSRVQFGQLVVDDAPRGHLFFRVLNARDRCPTVVANMTKSSQTNQSINPFLDLEIIYSFQLIFRSTFNRFFY